MKRINPNAVGIATADAPGTVKLPARVCSSLYGEKQRVEKPRVITFSHPPVRELKDMDEWELLALEMHYGCPVIMPKERGTNET